MSELRWLVALEAGLFFSVVCWETTASWAAPTYEPVPFALTLVAAATVGMLTCHVGPAFYASRFAVPGWVMAWLAFGDLEWLWGMAGLAWENPWPPAVVAGVVLCWRRAWQWGLAVSLVLGVGVLGWALWMQWPGIGAVNRYYSSGQETLFEHFTPGVLLAAAPAMVIAWRIGKVRAEAKCIWWSGFLGVWLPVVLAVGVASVACDAGATLHWRPSLFRGFYWAMQGVDRLNETALTLATGTLLAPAVASVWALGELKDSWTGRKRMLLVPLTVWAVAWGVFEYTGPGEGLSYSFFSTVHQAWAWGGVALGTVGGLRVLFLPVSGKMQYHHRDNV